MKHSLSILPFALLFALLFILLFVYIIKKKRLVIVNNNYQAMISSDWDIILSPGPWRSRKSATGSGAPGEPVIDCKKMGEDGVPIEILKSALNNYSKQVPNKNNRILFYCGNTLHKLSDYKNINTVLVLLLRYFDADKIFYVPGDLRTHRAMWQPDTLSKAWSNALLNNKIVKLDTENTQYFKLCGYYRKPIPNSNIDVIVVNTMLYSGLSKFAGCNRCYCQKLQKKLLKKDLDNIKENNKKVYILSHYPLTIPYTTDRKTTFWSLFGIDKKIYGPYIWGIFTAHLHLPMDKLETWNNGYMWNVPPLIPINNFSSYIKAEIIVSSPIFLTSTNINLLKCELDKTVSQFKWS